MGEKTLQDIVSDVFQMLRRDPEETAATRQRLTTLSEHLVAMIAKVADLTARVDQLELAGMRPGADQPAAESEPQMIDADRIEILRGNVDSLSAELQRARQESHAANERADVLRRERDELKDSLDRVRAEYEELSQSNGDLRKDKSALTNEIETVRHLAITIWNHYREPLKATLSPHQAVLVLRNLLRDFDAARDKALDERNDARKQLDGMTEARNRFCNAIGNIAVALGMAKRDSYAPEAVERAARETVENMELQRRRLARAEAIIERGDQRLLAGDGPAGGQPPQLTLSEWRLLYQIVTDTEPEGAVDHGTISGDTNDGGTEN